MRRSSEWHSFEWASAGLLALSAGLLGLCAAALLSYLPALTNPANTSTVTKYQSETEAALAGLREQQALTNSKLEAIRDELRALNEKAAGAANLAPPPQSTP